MIDKIYRVLFLCTGNSARSILAECILNRSGAGRFQAFSAGSHPTGTVNPYALELLRQLDYRTEQLRSKDWSEYANPNALNLDFVITVCDRAAGEVCPVWPGQPIGFHWGLPDPAAAEGTEAQRRRVFADTYRILSNRIEQLVKLPMGSLDRAGLHANLNAIGTRELSQ